MSDAKTERSINFRAERYKTILADLRELVGEDDEGLLSDTYEGQTGFFEMIDDVLEIINVDENIVSALKQSILQMQTRKTRKEKRIDRLRSFLTLTLDEAKLKSCERPTATLSVKLGAPKLNIVDETEIPSQFWKRADPKLDRSGLLKTIKERMAAQADARESLCADDEALKTQLNKIDQEMPPIDGVELSPAELQISIRRS